VLDKSGLHLDLAQWFDDVVQPFWQVYRPTRGWPR
jgi:hypothetical protein